MNLLLNKITTYFERDPELRVLFIFHDAWVADDLDRVEWPEGYRWVRFIGDWFTTKYRLDHEWANDKVVIYFDQVSPLEKKSLQSDFPLMDVLAANMEFHMQDAAAFMQQYDIPLSMTNFVDKNIQQLQSSKMMRLLEQYYRDGSITEDVAVRAFLSSYMGLQRVLDWDNILLEVIFLGRKTMAQKRMEFFNRLRKNKTIVDKLQQRLTDIFGTGYDDNTEEKVGNIVQILKYNAITQNLAPIDADDYKKYRISDSYALQQMNRLIELARSQDSKTQILNEVFEELGGSIRDENIIKWYGTQAKYNFVPDGLCIPIVKTLLGEKIETEPTAVIQRLEDLIIRHHAEDSLSNAMDYAVIAARYYEYIQSLETLTLNTPDDYVAAYQHNWYRIDQLYRLSTEAYYTLQPDSKLFETMQAAKKKLDLHYAKYSNRMNLQWTECVKDAGGFGGIHILRQQDFYAEKVAPVQKKLVVIISDALRYEVAEELIGTLAKRKHVAHLDAALAMLPTETKFCKPAMLPHQRLKLYGDTTGQNMAVDNKILDKTIDRSKHLESYKENAICVDYSEVSDYDQDKNREIFKHPLVYVMHDNIDRKGHGGTAEDVVENCRKTISELDTLIHKIHETYNVTQVIVTADHGFLFNDKEFKEKDKFPVEEEALEKTTRYYLTNSEEPAKGVAKYRLSDVSGMVEDGNIFVAVPEGTNRFNAPSGGYMFTHGGASLEEMIIPVLISQHERVDTKQSVGVFVLDQKLSVQASRLRFKLLQTDAVSMEMKGRVVTCALYDGDEMVTAEKPYTLDKTDPSLDNRKIQVDLTLNKNVESKVLQLRIYDATDEQRLNPLAKVNVTNNTLIENDFDF